MQCQRCKSDRILEICIKNHGDFSADFKGLNIACTAGLNGIYSGGYTDPKICLECGQIQGKFPIADPESTPEDNTQPPHTDAATMLNDIMKAKYQNILSADDPIHLYFGFSCYNVDKHGNEADTNYYTIHFNEWAKFMRNYEKMRRFQSAKGRACLCIELKHNRNFYEWYATL